ncbi:MAG: hypothetical protein MI743_01785 [Sneathiellales bacterium]|nr:hypothetical protein [Sneathiellales bacterium]
MAFDFTDGRLNAEVTQYNHERVDIILTAEKTYAKTFVALWIVITFLIVGFGIRQIEIMITDPGQIFVLGDTAYYALILAVDIAYLYPVCVLLFNKSVIHIDRDKLSLRHSPLWNYGAFSLPISEITGISTIEKKETLRLRRSWKNQKIRFFYLIVETGLGKKRQKKVLLGSEELLSFVGEKLTGWLREHAENNL